MVVRDILRPSHDVVRASGADDPSGGVLDGATDAAWVRSVAAPRSLGVEQPVASGRHRTGAPVA